MICKRDTDDPLLRLFVERYHLHLLAIPRAGAEVGDLYVESGGRIGVPGRLGGILEPDFTLPVVRMGERLADIEGKLTREVETGMGATIAESLLSGLGLPMGLGAKTTIKRASGIEFRFHEVLRDSIDVFALGRALTGHTLAPDHPAVGADARLYLTTAVVRTAAITIVTNGKPPPTSPAGSLRLSWARRTLC